MVRCKYPRRYRVSLKGLCSMKKSFRAVRLLICIAAAGAAFGIALYLPSFIPVVCAFAAAMGAAWGVLYSLPVLCANAVVMYFTTIRISGDPAMSAYVNIIMYFLLLAGLTGLIRQKVPYRYILLALTVILAVGTYLTLTVDSIVAGNEPETLMRETWDAVASDAIAQMGAAGIDTSTMVETAESVSIALSNFLMAGVLISSEATALFTLLITCWFMKIFKAKPREMAPFYRWRLPKSIVWGTLVLIAFSVILSVARVSAAAAFGYAIAVPLISMFALQGVSYCFYIFRRMRSPTPVYITTILMGLFTMPISLLAFASMGVIEQIANKRLLYESADRRMKLEEELRKKRADYEKYGDPYTDIKEDRGNVDDDGTRDDDEKTE